MNLDFKPSHYQKAIFDFIKNGEGNLLIQAYAGAGKTGTILKATEYIPKNESSIFVAFNRDIANEIQGELKNIDTSCKAQTLHGAGFSSFFNNLTSRPITDFNKLDNIIKDVVKKEGFEDDMALRAFLKKIIPLVKSTLSDTSVKSLDELQRKHNIDRPVGSFEAHCIKEILRICKQRKNITDFDDMIWLPLMHNFTFKKYDWIFVDELQDVSPSQNEIIKKLCHKNTRVIGVGDVRQCMYQFRGIDTNVMNNFKKYFNATELPLSICYRCPPNITQLAQTIVPEIEVCDKPDGILEEVTEEQLNEMAKTGDIILCRTNAPLIKLAFEFIRQHRKIVILGRDMCKNLLKLIKNYKTNDIVRLREQVLKLRRLQHEHICEIRQGTFDKSRMGELVATIDKCDTLLAIAENVSSIPELKRVINDIFSDSEEGIILSTVHKAKGSGHDRVFIYGYNSLMPLQFAETESERQQEMNIKYVAITRAQKELYLCN